MNNASYTSDLLCHFVGRSLKTEEAQYQLLLKILKDDKKLFADVLHPEITNPAAEFMSQYLGMQQGEFFKKSTCVCFCDIPDSSLDIHRTKYSSFGIGFKKDFLIKQGTRPVAYVPKNVVIEEFLKTPTPKIPEDYYMTLARQSTSLFFILMMLDQQYSLKNLFDGILEVGQEGLRETVEQFVLKYVSQDFDTESMRNLVAYWYSAWISQLAFTKVFDNELPDEDIDNYYMEREWRSLTSVSFTLEDVHTIYLPNSDFRNRLKKDIAEYEGQFYLFS